MTEKKLRDFASRLNKHDEDPPLRIMSKHEYAARRAAITREEQGMSKTKLDQMIAYVNDPRPSMHAKLFTNEEVADALRLLNAAAEAAGKLRRGDLPDREQPLWDEINTALTALRAAGLMGGG